MKAADVAVELSPEPLSVTGEPTCVPLGHTAAEEPVAHSVKVTVPVGAPPVELPVTVAVSVTEPPRVIVPEPVCEPDCCVESCGSAADTEKHSAGPLAAV